jgi:hypothetical protein
MAFQYIALLLVATALESETVIVSELEALRWPMDS